MLWKNTDKLISLVIKLCDWVANLKENKKMTEADKWLDKHMD